VDSEPLLLLLVRLSVLLSACDYVDSEPLLLFDNFIVITYYLWVVCLFVCLGGRVYCNVCLFRGVGVLYCVFSCLGGLVYCTVCLFV